jgi:hypothetical protein
MMRCNYLTNLAFTNLIIMPIIGISGKRNICSDDEPRIRAEIFDYINEFQKQCPDGSFTALSSIAIGADSIFADIVLNEFKQPLHAILPFNRIEYAKDFSSEELKRFNEIISRADTVLQMADEVPTTFESRNQCYLEAGIYIVDRANAMIFVSDGQKPAGEGGTLEIISYAYEQIPIVPNHIITITPTKIDELHKRINQVFNVADLDAESNRDKHRQTWKYSLFMGWLAVILFSIKTGFKIHEDLGLLWTFAEFLLVSATISLVLRANKNNYHAKYLSQRIRAEQLRLLEIYYLADIPVTVPFLTEVSDINLKNIKSEVDRSLTSRYYKSKRFANYKIKELINGQINYHHSKIASIEKKQPHFYHKVNLYIGILFCANLTFHLICESLEAFKHVHIAEFWTQLSVCFTIALPASYAAIEGILHFEDWEMIKKHSEVAEKGLSEALNAVPTYSTELDDINIHDNQVDALNKSASIMLDDNKKWEIVLEEKANYHWI